MNILPKKRWHVRSKENIARVRRDEAKAAEEEKAKLERIKLAESEARLIHLKKLAQEKYGNKFQNTQTNFEENDQNEHINFFSNIEEGDKDFKKVNTEHEKEKKEEREKYEKKIGYLTYLGQDTNEALGKKSWFNVAPDRSTSKEEVNLKTKLLNDPLCVIKKYLEPKKDEKKLPARPNKQQEVLQTEKTCNKKRKRSSSASDNDKIKRKSKHKRKKHKHEKHKSNKKRIDYSSSEESFDDKEKEKKKIQFEILRSERIKREQEERARAEKLLAKLRGESEVEVASEETFILKQKYNSQFNPELAKQNYEHSNKK